MILWILLLLIVGLALSAFFSGSETGFYRVTRVRLVVDARAGNWISRALLWLANHTSLFVATVLIGNNLANYLMSLGLVFVSKELFDNTNRLQAMVPLLATPVIFVLGELLPKLFFYQAPYRLMRAGAPLMILCSLLFLPISSIVLAYEAIWAYLTGKSRSTIGYSLGKQEIQRTLKESQEAGVVTALQRDLAENVFIFGGKPIRQFAIPIRAIPLVDVSSTRQQIASVAERSNSTLIGVTQNKRLIGCCLASEVQLDPQNPLLPLLPICEFKASEPCIQALTRMQAMHAHLATVTDVNGQILGVVTRDRLTSLLISG
jgi:putative hemolysin